jgi:hypothetical protein
MWLIVGLIIDCAVWFGWMANHAEMGWEDQDGFHPGVPK